MSERSNEALWKKELNELDHLPGENWDTTAAWEKLEQRLAPKSRRKLVLYWSAAACLLLVLCMQWIGKTSNEKELAKHQAIKPKTEQAFKQFPATKDIDLVVPPTAQKERTVVSTEKKKIGNTGVNNRVQLNKLELPITTPFNDNITEEVTGNAVTDTISLELDLAKTPKKTLRVVHINELGKPVEEKKGLAQVRRIASGASFINNDVYTNSYSADDNILKIKLSPNN